MKKALVVAFSACVGLASPVMAQTANFGFDGSFSISSGLGPMTTPVTLSGTTTLPDVLDGSFTINNFQLMSALGNYNLGTGTVKSDGSTLSLYEGASTFIGTFALSNVSFNGMSGTANGTLIAGNQDFTLPDGNLIGIQAANGTFSLAETAGAVPEPATWAMMLMGFAVVGGGLRYRRKSAAVRFA